MRHVLDDLLFTASTTMFDYIRIEPTSSEITVYAADVINKTLFLNVHLPLIDDLANIGPFAIGRNPKLLTFIRKQIVNGDGELSVSADKTSLVLSNDGLVSKYYKFAKSSMAPMCRLKSTPQWSHLPTISPTSSPIMAITQTMTSMKSFCGNQFFLKIADGFVSTEILAKSWVSGSDLGDTCSIFRLCNTDLPDNPPIRYDIDKFLAVLKAARKANVTVLLSTTTGLMQCSFSRDVAGHLLTYDFILPGRHA